MKKNKNTQIHGKRVVLVPYRKEHVLRYHAWMQSGELQQLTASEPLSLEEEYRMQQSWLLDDNKCTFIVLDADTYQRTLKNEVESMVGDVNLFFNEDENPHTAEIEIMIAEASCRGKGLGKEALLTMIKYGVCELGINRITAKIGMDNISSLALFEKMGFKEISKSEVFEEVTFELNMTDSTSKWLHKETEHYEIKMDYEGPEDSDPKVKSQ